MSIATDLTTIATNLDTALDAINDQIEAKGGTASETVYGVAAAVEDLPGGDNPEEIVSKINASIRVSGNANISITNITMNEDDE